LYQIPTPKFDFVDTNNDMDESEELFFDKDFPCDESCLYDKNSDKSIPGGALMTKQWLRPHEIKGVTDPQLFIGDSSAGDVIQGGLGNCWFLGNDILIKKRRIKYIRNKK
jgi:hypothetical protein